jgi:hypothetical protein
MTVQHPIPFEICRQGNAPQPPSTLGVHGSLLRREILAEIDLTDAPAPDDPRTSLRRL